MGNQKSKDTTDGAGLDDVKKLSRIMHVSEKQLQKLQKAFKGQSKVCLYDFVFFQSDSVGLNLFILFCF